jgi:Sugar kinases, ribokinase family
MEKKFDLITLGEIMLRLSPPSNERLARSDAFEKHAGGSEVNVACGAAMLGLRAGVVSKLPENQLGTYIKNKIRFSGVSDDFLVYDSDKNSRVGIYYYESASHPRKPAVVYDRLNSAFSNLKLEEIPEEIYSSTKVFHTSGITLGLTEDTKRIAIEMIKRFKEHGTLISIDVNFRANLWTEPEARICMEEILPYVDIFFASEETCYKMFQKTGTLEEMMKSFCDEFGVKVVATTERKIISPRKHVFGSKIYSAKEDKYYSQPPYENIEVVDRIGSGDAYVGGMLFGMIYYDDFQKAVEFGNAMSAVKNTIPGDMPASDFKEISAVIEGHEIKIKGGETREMAR